jgi:hypothetical protein
MSIGCNQSIIDYHSSISLKNLFHFYKNMKPFLRYKFLPVIAGLFAAFVTMMAFEYTNSFIFPFPE